MPKDTGQAGAQINVKISAIPKVREWIEEMPVELWFNREGRVVLKAFNECGYNCTEIDVFDLLDWFDEKGTFNVTRNEAHKESTRTVDRSN